MVNNCQGKVSVAVHDSASRDSKKVKGPMAAKKSTKKEADDIENDETLEKLGSKQR